MEDIVDAAFRGISPFFLVYWSDTDEELKEWKAKFEEKIALLETKIRKLEREENDAESKITFLEKTLKESIWEISKLENEAEVNELHTF